MTLTSTDNWHRGEFSLLTFWKQPFYLFFSSENLCSSWSQKSHNWKLWSHAGGGEGKWQETWQEKKHWKLEAETMVTWITCWRKEVCSRFYWWHLGSKGFTSAVMSCSERNDSPPGFDICEMAAQTIHTHALWSISGKEWGGKTGANPVQGSVSQEAWGVFKGGVCVQRRRLWSTFRDAWW